MNAFNANKQFQMNFFAVKHLQFTQSQHVLWKPARLTTSSSDLNSSSSASSSTGSSFSSSGSSSTCRGMYSFSLTRGHYIKTAESLVAMELIFSIQN